MTALLRQVVKFFKNKLPQRAKIKFCFPAPTFRADPKNNLLDPTAQDSTTVYRRAQEGFRNIFLNCLRRV